METKPYKSKAYAARLLNKFDGAGCQLVYEEPGGEQYLEIWQVAISEKERQQIKRMALTLDLETRQG